MSEDIRDNPVKAIVLEQAASAMGQVASTAGINVRAGLRLSFIGTVLAGVLQFVTMMIMVRLLAPADYGVYALCAAIASLSAVFVTNVIERVLVVTAGGIEEQDPSLLIVMLCIAATAIALMICFASNRAGFSHIDLQMQTLTCLAAVINALAIPPRVSLRREILFGPIVVAEISGLLFGQGLIAILCALAGWGAYALVAAAIVQAMVIVLLLRVRRSTGLLLLPTPSRLVAMVRLASGLGGNAATEIANGQVSPLVLGTRLGAVSLGLFNRSYSLVQMPIQLLTSSMSRVMISALFSVSDDRERLREMARSLVQVTAIMVTPVAAGIAGAAHNFVLLAFGTRWLAAQSIIPLLAMGAWGMMMGTLYGIVAESMSAFGSKTRNQLISTGLLIVLSVSGASLGLVGAVAGIALSNLIFLLLFVRLAAQLLSLPMRVVLRWLVPGFVAAAPCLAISAALGTFLHGPGMIVFIAQIAGCAVADGMVLLLVYPNLTLRIVEGMAPRMLRKVPLLANYLRRAGQRQSR